MNLVFVTTCTPNYDKPWIFPTLGLLQDRVICLLDPKDDRPLTVNCERRDYHAYGVLHQDGRFIHALPELRDEDVVALLDADGIVQRPLNGPEKAALMEIGAGMALGYNLVPGERGEQEYLLLRPKQSIEEAARYLKMGVDTLANTLIYNTGMMVAKVATWKRLYQLSHAMTDNGVGDLFNVHSWPQYLICCILADNKIPVTELGYLTHSHGHFPFTLKHEIKARQLYYERQRVFFAHNTVGVTH